MNCPLLYARIEADNVRHVPRMHLGASEAGEECTRMLYYKVRWAAFFEWEPRMLRLFDRGQRSELGIFIPLLRSLGMTVLDVDKNTGEQFRIESFNGHFKGSLDGVIYGVPDLPNVWMLLEFKTHNLKHFKLLVKEKVRKSKPKHFAQMQLYMHFKGLKFALYCAVCKDDDKLYFEIVQYDSHTVSMLLLKIETALFSTVIPRRIKTDPNAFECKFCDYKMICHFNKPVHRNCRSCQHVIMLDEGGWACSYHNHDLNKQQIISGCNDYTISKCLEADRK